LLRASPVHRLAAKREGVEASLRQLESHQQQALRQQQVTHVAQMHALQSRLQGEVGEMRQACAVLRTGRDAADAAELMAAREALQTRQAALELSLRGLLAAASGDNGDGGSDSTPSGDGGSPGDGTLGGGDAAWREGCEELEELEELEEQLATLRLQLHIADDELQQRRQSSRMVETPSPAAACAVTHRSQEPIRLLRAMRWA